MVAETAKVLGLVVVVGVLQATLGVPSESSFVVGLATWSAIAALVMGVSAWRAGESLLSTSLTRWDSAVFFSLLSLVCGWTGM